MTQPGAEYGERLMPFFEKYKWDHRSQVSHVWE